MNKRFHFSTILLLLFLNCVHYTQYVPDPEKDIEKWVKNFGQQRSFSYQYELATHLVHARAKGDCIIGRGERISGVWNYPDSELGFEYIGLGDIQYMKKDKEWQESSRGEESDVFTQIQRLMTFGKFEYFGPEDGFLYGFKANIPFLAPGRRKEMVGLIKISKRNFLPALIWAGLPDSSIYWKAEISNYNRVKNIKPPFQAWKSYVVMADSTLNSEGFFKAIKRRLDKVSVDYRIKKTEQGIILTVPSYYSIEDLESMLVQGVVDVYGLVWNKEDATKVGYLNDDINCPLFMTDRVFDHNNIKHAQIKFDGSSKPYILISLNKKLDLPKEIVFEIDGLIIGTAELDTSKKIDRIILYNDMQYYEMEILQACLTQILPSVHLRQVVEEIN